MKNLFDKASHFWNELGFKKNAQHRSELPISTQSHQPIFTQDWFSGNIGNWDKLLQSFKHQPNLKFLEIGSFEGCSSYWLLKNILTHSTARMYCIDAFEEYEELYDLNIDMKKIEEKFYYNIQPYRQKVSIFQKTPTML